MKTPKSLGDKISEQFVPSEDLVEDEDIETRAKLVEFSEDEEFVVSKRSTLRTKNVPLLESLDSRYAGVKVSRDKASLDEDEQSNEDDGFEDESSEEDKSGSESDPTSDLKQMIHRLGDIKSSDENAEDSEDPMGAEDSDEYETTEERTSKNGNQDLQSGEEDSLMSESDEDGESDEGSDDQVNEDLEDDNEESITLMKKHEDKEKANAVQNQLKIWDSLIEIRIRLQKVLTEANKLPQVRGLEEAMNISSDLTKQRQKSKKTILKLLGHLLKLHDTVLQDSELNPEKLKRKADNATNPEDEEITSSDEDDASTNNNAVSKPAAKRPKISSNNAEKVVAKQFTAFRPFVNSTIQKWEQKTTTHIKSSGPPSIVGQINYILKDKERLLRRTQLKRTSYLPVGKCEEEECDEEIFDDDDFYHFLLKELIDKKTSGTSNPLQLSKNWLELQKFRNKFKRKVDTRASKGRKIRYDVHQKLVNFMAPQSTVFDESVQSSYKELFHSLFK